MSADPVEEGATDAAPALHCRLSTSFRRSGVIAADTTRWICRMGTLLIVSEDAGTRFRLRAPLQSSGYVIEEASETSDALARVRAAQFDLVVMTIPRDGSGAVDLVVSIRERGSTPKIVVADTGTSDVSGGAGLMAVQALGADAILYHPFSDGELAAVVDQLLS